MKASVNAVLFKSKTLSNGEHPLMIRICKNNKKKYKSLGLSVHPDNWDFEKNKPKRNCPNKDQIISLINSKLKEYSEQIIEFTAINKEYTASSLVERIDRPASPLTVKEFFVAHINQLKLENRVSYSLTFSQLLNSLIEYNGHLDIYFSELDSAWLKRYEVWLRNYKQISNNTIAIRFRTLRALYNAAINEDIVRSEYYPFKTYKVSQLAQETPKRSLSKKDIEAVINYHSDHEYTSLAVDLFAFSYLVGGINFVDIAYLKDDNVVDGRLVYIRKKTKKLIKLPIHPKAYSLIYKYKKVSDLYLFPILSKYHQSDQQKANRIHKVITKVNKCLKTVGQELNLPIDITTYVARHSENFF